MNVPAIFSDYCEEACHLAVRCINASTDHPLRIPVSFVSYCLLIFLSWVTLLLELLRIEKASDMRIKTASSHLLADPTESIQATFGSRRKCPSPPLLFKLLPFWDLTHPRSHSSCSCHMLVLAETIAMPARLRARVPRFKLREVFHSFFHKFCYEIHTLGFQTILSRKCAG